MYEDADDIQEYNFKVLVVGEVSVGQFYNIQIRKYLLLLSTYIVLTIVCVYIKGSTFPITCNIFINMYIMYERVHICINFKNLITTSTNTHLIFRIVPFFDRYHLQINDLPVWNDNFFCTAHLTKCAPKC
jgi:hypothetical protein